jgi:hypothetical protein
MDKLKKIFVLFSVIGALVSAGRSSFAIGMTPFAVQAQEALTETDTQKWVKDEANRKRAEIREALSEERTEFVQQLQSVSNEQKRERALEAMDEISAIRTRTTDRYIKAIGELDSIMQAMTIKVRDMKATGSDTEAVWPKLSEAGTIMGEARGLILSQIGYVYNIEGSSEEVLATEVGEARNALYANLGEARGAIQRVRNALAEAIRLFNNANN